MYDTSAAIFYAADPANQGYSRYGYCGGNPVILIDPTGKYWEPNYYVDGVQITSENYNENYASHVDTYMQSQQHGMFNNANHQRQHQRNLASQRRSLTSLDGLMGSSDGSPLLNSIASESEGSIPDVSMGPIGTFQGVRQLFAIVVSECGWQEQFMQAAAIASLALKINDRYGETLNDDFVADLIKVRGNYPFLGVGENRKEYQHIMGLTSWSQLLDSRDANHTRIAGAMLALMSGLDYTGGYFMSRFTGPGVKNSIWEGYLNGTYTKTIQYGEHSFFRYTDNPNQYP